ncbi:MAG: hypothetical protein WAV74_18550 [Anaerolineae bacterium]
MVAQDWKREVTPLQEAVNSSLNENEELFHMTKAFSSLQPLYLKCLFSYAVFFIAIEGAYDRFYEELNALNQKPFFRVKHNKKPKPTAYVEKVRMIRNISIAHIGSKKERAANSAAAMMWQPMTLSKKTNESWNLDSMAFGAMKLTLRDATGTAIDQSDDLEIKGVLDLDKQCKQYLDEYDSICSDYLKAIHARLPIDVGDEKYLEFKLPTPNP